MPEFLQPVFSPKNTDHIGIFYLVWMSIFISLNIIWDIISDKTEPFHVLHMQNKTGVVYNSATFCSSLLLILALFQPQARILAGDVFIPLVLAGFSGITQSISAICPYPISALSSKK